MPNFKKLTAPSGVAITAGKNGSLQVPDRPIIPYVEGDGIGPDIWKASQTVFDAAVAKAYQGKRKIEWFEIFAGEKAMTVYGEALPEDTLTAIKTYLVAIKGPLTTPVGGGFRSLNVAFRQILDLYACVRPVRYFRGVPSPVTHPEKTDCIVFRENTEDVYAGIEWQSDTAEAKKVIDFLNGTMGKKIRPDSGIGIKPMSPFGSKRLIRKAYQHALGLKEPAKRNVTLVHKGNIMKFTEGAFRDWGYELAQAEFADQIISETAVGEGKAQGNRVLVKDRIADAMFQQVLLRPDEYSVLATPNLNGDYISDALAAQVGGLGMAPGGNLSDDIAFFEATHGTAPKYAGLDKVNPGSLILSGEMMLRHMGWHEAADLVIRGIEKTIERKTVTYDLERQMAGARLLKCSEFGRAIAENM